MKKWLLWYKHHKRCGKTIWEAATIAYWNIYHPVIDSGGGNLCRKKKCTCGYPKNIYQYNRIKEYLWNGE